MEAVGPGRTSVHNLQVDRTTTSAIEVRTLGARSASALGRSAGVIIGSKALAVGTVRVVHPDYGDETSLETLLSLPGSATRADEVEHGPI